jgi:uncharacterized protein YbjT (DUF2867 family)
MEKKRIAVVGATGYLGKYLVKELLTRGLNFVAVARNVKKLQGLGLTQSQIIEAEVTRPETLRGAFDDIDIVITTVGITRQKDGLTYMDVDYQANMNLLFESRRAGVKKMIYVSAINGVLMRHLKIMEAKELFVDALKATGIDHTIIRPNGFFSDMTDFLKMAKGGRVFLFGNGEYKLNPIHGADLAAIIVDSLDGKESEIIVGGPDILTQNEIAHLALKALNKPGKVIHIPDWVRRMLIALMRRLTSSRVYGPYEFFLTMMAQDNLGPRYGIHRLEPFFKNEADKLR